MVCLRPAFGDNTCYPVGSQWWVYAVAPLLAIPIFVRFGLYRAIFRYTGQAALVATGKALSALRWRR